MILIFDTETTGLIKNWNQKTDGSDNFPNIIQFAWQLYNFDGKLICQSKVLIKPKGWVIEEEAQSLHGVSLEMCEEKGILIEEALRPFLILHRICDFAVAHNHNFDSKIVRSEMIRLNSKYTSEDFKSKKFLCTMMETTNFCKLQGKNGYKWPKLIELYEKLFGESFDDQHDAMGDVVATAKCLFELKRIGVLNF